MTDENRQDILFLIEQNGKMTVNEIAENSSLSRSTISHHLKLMRDVGILSVEKVGTSKFHYATLDESIHQLENLLANLKESNTKKKEE